MVGFKEALSTSNEEVGSGRLITCILVHSSSSSSEMIGFLIVEIGTTGSLTSSISVRIGATTSSVFSTSEFSSTGVALDSK